MIEFVKNDGGRAAAGFKGTTGDCVCRAVAIASGRPYAEVYARIQSERKTERRQPKTGKKSSARTGVFTNRKWFRDYMAELGFEWVSCMGIGTGCQVHFRGDELPMGRLIVSLSRHYAAVIDKVLCDSYDSSRDGTRCVYGYWRLKQ